MKTTLIAELGFILFSATLQVQGQFSYSVNPDGISVTITGYTGSGGAASIPAITNGLIVTGVAADACVGDNSITSLTIPGTVNTIGDAAFYLCEGMKKLVISNGVVSIGVETFEDCGITNIVIPGSVSSIGQEAFIQDQLSSIIISNGVKSIGIGAFADNDSFTSITIPGSVTTIASGAFGSCTSLARIYFTGNAPSTDPQAFGGDSSNPTVYYLPGSTGFLSPFAGRQVLLWNPAIQTGGTNCGIQNGQFYFNITGTPYIPFVVEAATSLSNPVWLLLQTNAMGTTPLYFSDTQWTNYPARFYRIGSQ